LKLTVTVSGRSRRESEEEEEEGEVCGRSDHDGRVSAYGALQYGERVSGWDVD
jgi:hypothetical protein